MRDAAQKEYLLRWRASYIADQGVDANWVHDSLAPIKKTSFNLAAKLWWSIARAKLSPTIADNHLTRDRVVMVACLMVGYELDFAYILIVEIHE